MLTLRCLSDIQVDILGKRVGPEMGRLETLILKAVRLDETTEEWAERVKQSEHLAFRL